MSKSITGVVVSTKIPLAVTIEIETKLRHPEYKKIITRSKKIRAHNEIKGIVEGDIVEIRPCRPISKTKHHQVVGKVN